MAERGGITRVPIGGFDKGGDGLGQLYGRLHAAANAVMRWCISLQNSLTDDTYVTMPEIDVGLAGGGRLMMEEAYGIAREIAAKSPRAMKWIKRGYGVAENLPFREAYRYEQSITHDLAQAPDTIEAQSAFVEKRKADDSAG